MTDVQPHPCHQGVARGNWNYGKCSRRAVTFEDGRWWCRIHTPSLVREKRDRRHAKIDRDMARSQARYDVQTIEKALAVAVRAASVFSLPADVADLRYRLLEADARLAELTRQTEEGT